jgi:predicted AAA+ superfamily ATPase
MLLKKIRESLAGRCQIIELYPLTLPELLTNSWEDEVNLSWFQKLMLMDEEDNQSFLLDESHAKKQMAFDHYLNFGGYPAISEENITDEERFSWLYNYIRTYLERDIRDLAELNRLEPFAKTQRLMAINTGQTINYSQIAVEAGVTSKTVQRFIEYMTISYQTLVLQPWSRNSKKKLVKSPKIHFVDPGIFRAILQNRGLMNGNQFESAIAAEIYKQIKTAQIPAQMYHLRTSDGREIDVLIETEKGYIAIEIKQSSKVRAADARHLKKIEEILDKPVLHKFILSNDLEDREFYDYTKAIPAVKFLT